MRWKIILPNMIVMLLVGVGAWLYLNSYYVGHFDRRANAALERDRGLFESTNQLRAVQFLRTVVARSRNPQVPAIFGPARDEEIARLRSEYGTAPAAAAEGGGAAVTDEELRMILRLRAHAECQAVRASVGREGAGGRTPEIVAVTDRHGVVISRDVDPNAEPVGQNLGAQFPSIGRALEGNAVRDIWYWNAFLLDVAIAPITTEAGVVGALFVGYDISNGVASADRDLFGDEVVFVLQQNNEWRVHSASIQVGAKRESLVRSVAAGQQDITRSLAEPDATHFMELDVAGEPYVALAGPLTGEGSSVLAGYILLASVAGVRQPARQSIVALFFGLGGALLVLIVGFVLGSHFLKPVEEIEEGILRVINGDREHRFEVKSSEFGGLAYRVNQLVSELTGEEESDEPDATGRGFPPE